MNQPEREAFAREMLDDVIAAVIGAGCEPLILSTHPYTHKGAKTVLKDTGLNEALNEYICGVTRPILVIMADIPLATPESVSKILETAKDCAIVPGRGGGTNAIFIKKPQMFHFDFYGASYLDHMNIAAKNGLCVEIIDSFRLHTDIDEKEDLVEILLHGTGRSRSFLERFGFSLSLEKGRVGIQRNPHEEAF
jgi:2-phospho-L-lactate guanylyltransferase